MGIKDLWSQALGNIKKKDAVPFSTFKRRVVGIDVSIWLHTLLSVILLNGWVAKIFLLNVLLLKLSGSLLVQIESENVVTAVMTTDGNAIILGAKTVLFDVDFKSEDGRYMNNMILLLEIRHYRYIAQSIGQPLLACLDLTTMPGFQTLVTKEFSIFCHTSLTLKQKQSQLLWRGNIRRNGRSCWKPMIMWRT
jgi:hypothetical protein